MLLCVWDKKRRRRRHQKVCCDDDDDDVGDVDVFAVAAGDPGCGCIVLYSRHY